ncbi:MAG TPA: heme-binding domain-containing protein, partial [Bryobacteraceae bacterium]
LAIASVISAYRPAAKADTPLLEGAQVTPEARAVIERACRDCHSDATHYPWYAYIAPVSWLINSDVKRGRERLNFSSWKEYSVMRRERRLSDIANQVQDGKMPLGIYTWMHPQAKLSDRDVKAIFDWTQAERVRLIQQRAGDSK